MAGTAGCSTCGGGATLDRKAITELAEKIEAILPEGISNTDMNNVHGMVRQFVQMRPAPKKEE